MLRSVIAYSSGVIGAIAAAASQEPAAAISSAGVVALAVMVGQMRRDLRDVARRVGRLEGGRNGTT